MYTGTTSFTITDNTGADYSGTIEFNNLAYKHVPSMDVVKRLCRVYGITPEQVKSYDTTFEPLYIMGEFDADGEQTGTPHVEGPTVTHCDMCGEPAQEVIKFELYGDNETYYCFSEMDMQTFAEWEGKEVFTWGIALHGLPSACLPLNEHKSIFVDYGKPNRNNNPTASYCRALVLILCTLFTLAGTTQAQTWTPNPKYAAKTDTVKAGVQCSGTTKKGQRCKNHGQPLPQLRQGVYLCRFHINQH